MKPFVPSSKTIKIVLCFTLIAVICSACNRKNETDKEPYTKASIDSVYFAMNPMDLLFDSLEMKMIAEGLPDLIRSYHQIRAYELPNNVPPAFQFNPIPPGLIIPEPNGRIHWDIPEGITKPEKEGDLAFLSIPELARILRAGEITCVDLTEFYLARLRKYDSVLHCVVTFTGEYALEFARKMDEELAAGNDRGILHGIPYGAKDLFAFPGYKTTWGAQPYAGQVIDDKAGVIRKLEEAGAVLIAKTTLGALAMGDVWFADTTRNPWNPEEGSSGSSAGSASATAAGLLPFAIGTETWGSIVSPSTRCGTTSLRPTYGRITRSGAMALSWTMDKVGPICRSAEECAIVFDAIRGPDPSGKDQTLIEAGFTFPAPADLSAMKIGYVKSAFESGYEYDRFDKQTLRVLRKLGAELIPVELDNDDIPCYALSIILEAEAAAAFDELTRSNRDTLMVRQGTDAWPHIFRTARFIPAVEYIQANRIRHELITDLNRRLKTFDAVVVPSFEGSNQLLATNLTGHPCVVVPNGFKENSSPASITFLGNLFEEGKILAVAKAYQDATEINKKRPPRFDD
ncbi:MAG: amidase [Bacteroidales bacterium]|nr:amidase [Bacteroidales bacterium]